MSSPGTVITGPTNWLAGLAMTVPGSFMNVPGYIKKIVNFKSSHNHR